MRTGVNADGFVEIVDGLKEGEAIIARAGAFLRDGDAVKPVAAERTAAAAPESKDR
jgi:HlyD family secretion protein